MDQTDWRLLGRISSVHGIRGGLKFTPLNPAGRTLRPGLTVQIERERALATASRELVKISRVQYGNKVILYWEGLDDRGQAEQWVPAKLYVRRDDFPPLAPGEFYLEDLRGLKLVDEAGVQRGEVLDFSDQTAQILLQIRWNQELMELPMVDAYFGDPDWERRELSCSPPEEWV